MASGTVILRPDEDISGGNGTSYLYISEMVADDSSTVLGGRSEADKVEEEIDFSASYTFGLSDAGLSKKVNLTGAKIVYRCNIQNSIVSAFCMIGLLYNGTSIFSTMSSEDTGEFDAFVTYEAVASEEQLATLQDIIKENSNCIPELQLSVWLNANADYNEGLSLGKTSSVYLTQAYVELDYEEIPGIGIHKKTNGEYKEATLAYRKIDGAWVDISEDETKSILKNNVIRSG